METLVTTQALETTEEIVCEISKIRKRFQSSLELLYQGSGNEKVCVRVLVKSHLYVLIY